MRLQEHPKRGLIEGLNFLRTLEKARKIKEKSIWRKFKYGLKAARRAPQFSKR